MTNAFSKAYQNLNPSQKVVVDTLEGPVLVLAGPGTGKTQVLTLRIANILQKTDTPPSSIIALTFTEAATKEMRERLVKLIGQPGYFVRIHTFHGFCQSVFAENPDLFPGYQDKAPLNDLERARLLEDLIEKENLKILRPLNAPFHYLTSILSAIKDLKREGINTRRFIQIIKKEKEDFNKQKNNLAKTIFITREREILKLTELSRIYQAYQKRLKKNKLIDFEDLINEVVKRLKTDEVLRLNYQERFTYFLVDEYQDTNSAQNQLVFNLASFWGEKANLFAVGDPNQSIFRFQGASTENLKEFVARFPKATLINLTHNYRSTQNILDTAFALIGHNPVTPLLPSFLLKSNKKPSNKKIKIINTPDSQTECHNLANEIKKLHSQNIPWSDISILARNNQELLDLAPFLLKNKIPLRVEGGENILDHPLIKQFINLLRIVGGGIGEVDDLNLFTVLNYQFWQIDPLEILKAGRLASENRQSLYSYLLQNLPHYPQVANFIKHLAVWQQIDANSTFPILFETIFQESGFSDHLLKEADSSLLLGYFQDLFQLAQQQAGTKSDYHLSDFLSDLDVLIRQGIRLPATQPIYENNAVTLSTVHKSKGLEWPVVFIYKFIDRTWGNKIDRNLLRLPASILEFAAVDTDPNAEDRRLFYVALTRAKTDIFITYANQYATQGGVRETLPSIFLSELPENLIQNINHRPSKEEYLQSQQDNLSPTPPIVKQEKEYLKELLKEFRLSVTALNTYLDCPYKFKLNNLYRLPRAKKPHLSFGTAIHKALEVFHRNFQETKKIPSKKLLSDAFKKALQRETFTKEERKRRLEHGHLILSTYYDYYHSNLSPSVGTETSFGRPTSPCLFGEISLTGNVDRLDLINPNTKEVRVVDYKTGKPQTRNEIEGKTKNSTLHYKRQLVFYRLLGNLSKGFPYTIKEAELDFIEPDQAGKFRKERFIISDEEVEDLKKLIKETMQKINKLEFERTTNYAICKECEFLSHCWPKGLPSIKTNELGNQDT